MCKPCSSPYSLWIIALNCGLCLDRPRHLKCQFSSPDVELFYLPVQIPLTFFNSRIFLQARFRFLGPNYPLCLYLLPSHRQPVEMGLASFPLPYKNGWSHWGWRLWYTQLCFTSCCGPSQQVLLGAGLIFTLPNRWSRFLSCWFVICVSLHSFHAPWWLLTL